MYTLIALSVYILLLFAVSRLAQRGSNEKAFFDGGRRSPWYVVAFGMIGASISGVSFVSVPGMVGASGFTYMQMVLGFAVGYVVIAYLLLPVYYRQNKVSIYAFLEKRFGVRTHKTASCLFILSKSVVASARLYVAAIVLKIFVFDKLTEHETPFAVIVFAMMALIFLYTFRSGIKALVWTDFFQTFTLLFALCSIVAVVCSHLGIDNIRMLAEHVQHDPHTQFFVWNDWKDSRHFLKYFVSGIFITVVMTGLDQDMMQKNLTCKTLRQSQRNMLTYGMMFIPVNLILLTLGVLLLQFAQANQVVLPGNSDEILPALVSEGYFGSMAGVLFSLGLTASALSSADSAITALSTSAYIDLLGRKPNDHSRAIRIMLQSGFCMLFAGIILLFANIENKSALDTIYTIVSYTYGPLLGLFAYGLFTKNAAQDKYIPYICMLTIALVFAIDHAALQLLNYKFGYELLMVSGLITFVATSVTSKIKTQHGN
ncbi:MAG: sodium:solute symporter [Bacteroidales bacterium]|nr:sodium:solute symporter [Bacteroidales bacterium]